MNDQRVTDSINGRAFSFADINAALPQITQPTGIPPANLQPFVVANANNIGFRYTGLVFNQPPPSMLYPGPYGNVPLMTPISPENAQFDHSTPQTASSHETLPAVHPIWTPPPPPPPVFNPFVPPPPIANQIVPIAPTTISVFETYSCKVFLGGLPTDITGNEIVHQFNRFGPFTVDWPHRDQGRFPKGFAFLLFHYEYSVHELIGNCSKDDQGRLFFAVSSGAVSHKRVQVRPWCLADALLCPDEMTPVDPRKTVFIGGVLRPITAPCLAKFLSKMFGSVAYAEIDVDTDYKYPKGAARVIFHDRNAYSAAVEKTFIFLRFDGMEKQAEIKPYLWDDQPCDECYGEKCNGVAAPYFCVDRSCLQYYCKPCWRIIHEQIGKENHRMMLREPVVEHRF